MTLFPFVQMELNRRSRMGRIWNSPKLFRNCYVIFRRHHGRFSSARYAWMLTWTVIKT